MVTTRSGAVSTPERQAKPGPKKGSTDINENHSSLSTFAPLMAGLFGFLTVQFTILRYTFRDSPLLQPAPEFRSNCVEGESCTRSDMFAFQMTSFVPLTFCGVLGFYQWHILRNVHTDIPQTAAGRLFATYPPSQLIAAVCCTFQTWDFVVTLLIPEYCTAVFLLHHAAAAAVSFFAIYGNFLNYYGTFFLGLTEFSSIFLCWVDMGQYFPPQETGSAYDQFIFACGVAFALCFVVYRVIMWWPVSIQLARDVWTVVQNGQASKLRPGKEWVLYMYICCNIPLGILQLVWLQVLIARTRETLGI